MTSSDFRPHRRPFLTARWENLLVVTYAVPESLVAGHLPRGLSIDRLGGQARVSFVAFDFARTRVFGLPIPGNVNFPEVNLRFYVRAGDDRGIVFIRELVPKLAVVVVARVSYNEPYTRVPMRSDVGRVAGDASRLRVRHVLGERLSVVTAEVDAAGVVPADDSDGRWLTDHEFGFGRTRRGEMRQYRVEHPLWPLHTVHSVDLDVDFAGLYGPDWAFLARATPSHVTFAAGSEVAVYPPGA
ncbi:MAG TPA: DUF2071 domain-containing protein [Solirubrobacteraceae bacterium]|jgi:hypothetical protein|nr:DUF2071 domain-containing protein [Solirubrobacteraceae bacterium]